MSGIWSVLAAILLLSLLITVHELGHFSVGRKLGFKIEEFSVGMGPSVLSKKSNGILYSLRLFPIGGMCRFYGEDSVDPDQRSFNTYPVWKRILTVAAGPLTNIILAILLAIIMMIAYGNYMPEITEISGQDTPAYACGLAEGDIILSVNGEEIPYYSNAVSMIRNAGTNAFTLGVSRDGTDIELTVENAYDESLGYNRLGITLSPTRVYYSFFKAVKAGIQYVLECVKSTFTALREVLKGATEDISGPVGTVAVISQAVQYGFEVVLEFAILINLSVGIFNLLPLPALDGGRLLFMVIEVIRGKAVDPEKEGWVHFAGLILLLGLMVVLTYSDIRRLIG